jgi:hypothetical protein
MKTFAWKTNTKNSLKCKNTSAKKYQNNPILGDKSVTSMLHFDLGVLALKRKVEPHSVKKNKTIHKSPS